MKILLVDGKMWSSFIPSTSFQQIVEQTEVIQEQALRKVSKLNHFVMKKN